MSVHELPRPLSTGGRTVFSRMRERLRALLGFFLMALPGWIREVEIDDEVSGQHLTVSVSPWFTRLTINGRDFYFDRLTGRFDGTGSGA